MPDADSDRSIWTAVYTDDETAAERVLPRAPEVLGEVMPGSERRRRWCTGEKLRILAQSVAPGSSPALTCKLHGINSSQLYTRRKQFRRGELTGFVPVSRLNGSRQRCRHPIRFQIHPRHRPRRPASLRWSYRRGSSYACQAMLAKPRCVAFFRPCHADLLTFFYQFWVIGRASNNTFYIKN